MRKGREKKALMSGGEGSRAGLEVYRCRFGLDLCEELGHAARGALGWWFVRFSCTIQYICDALLCPL